MSVVSLSFAGNALVNILSKLGSYGASFVVRNPGLCIRLAGPEVAAYIMRYHLKRLFPNAVGLDSVVNILQSFAPAAAALGNFSIL
jgi:hypothetical protein